jgi:hypothetical protein
LLVNKGKLYKSEWLNNCLYKANINKMKTKSAVLLLLIAISSFAFKVDVIDDIATAIRSGNPKNISTFFIDNIDLKVIEQEDVYSKQQAEMILKDFFSKHAVKSYTVAHKSEAKAGSQYVIGTLETSNGKFRTYFLIKTTGAKTLIQQFRIETENE